MTILTYYIPKEDLLLNKLGTSSRSTISIRPIWIGSQSIHSHKSSICEKSVGVQTDNTVTAHHSPPSLTTVTAPCYSCTQMSGDLQVEPNQPFFYFLLFRPDGPLLSKEQRIPPRFSNCHVLSTGQANGELLR